MKFKLGEKHWRLVGLLGRGIVHLIFSTARIESVDLERLQSLLTPSGTYIAATWHSRILAFSYIYKGWNAAILVSASADGEIIARILGGQGFEPVRGSTSKGGLRALSSLIRRVRKGQSAVIIPDGPRGPRFRVQPGIIALARKTGVPILPMTYSAEKMIVFSSWDRFLLPYPFTRCRVVYGEPVFVPADADRTEEERYRERLEQELNRITTGADRHYGHCIE